MPPRLIRRILPPLIILIFAVAGSYMLLVAMAAEPWKNFAETVETSATPPSLSDRTIERLTRRIQSDHGRLCLFQLAESRTAIGLLLMRLADQAQGDAARRTQSIEDARKAVRDAIACNPANAYLWSVLAFVELHKGVAIERLSLLIQRSKALAPVDAGPLYQRSALMADFLGDPAFGSDPWPLKDFIQALKVLNDRDVILLLGTFERAGRAEVAQLLLAEVPAERRALVTRGVARERAKIAASQKRRFEFTPFGN